MADPTTPEIQALTKQPKAFRLPPAPELKAIGGDLGATPGVSEFPAKRAELTTSAQASAEQEKQLGRLSQVEAPILAAQQAGEQYKADVQSAIATQSREQAQDIEAGLDLVREKFPYPQFKPTQENMQSLATLFSLVGMIGVAIGGAGKNSAMNSLNAMSGMMKGWQQGRADIWKREKEEFDKNMAKTKAILDDAYKDADRAYKTLAYNREEAQALAGQSVAKLGGQVAKNILEKQGIERYISYLDGVRKDLRHAEDLASQEKREAARVEAQIARDNARYAQQEKLAREREDAAERRLERRLDAKEIGARTTQQQFIVQRAVNSLGGVASSMESINQLPSGTTVGILGNLTTKDGMSNYIRNFAGRKVSKPEEKAMETLFTGITRNLASIEASGTAMGLTVLAGQLEKLRPVAGDTAYDVALKMADIRRIATENMQPLIDSGLMPKQQKQTAQNLVSRIEKAIPYTTIDVVNALPSRGRQTAGEYSRAIGEKGRLNEEKQKRLRELEEKERQ